MNGVGQIKEFLNTVGYVTDSDIPDDDGQVYLSRQDNSYIARVGGEDNNLFKFLLEHGVDEIMKDGGNVACIGYSSNEGEWYGWSHRAIYGFGVGSEVKKGDCAYVADTPEGLIDDHAEFFSDISEDSANRHRAECQILDDRTGIRILHTPTVIPVVDSIDAVADALDGDDSAVEMIDITPGYTIIKCGKGAWTAKTLEDAKQMACDFAESVS